VNHLLRNLLHPIPKKPAAASTDTAKTETKTASSKDTKPSEKKDSNPKTENK